MGMKTLPALLFDNLNTRADKTALREKDYGIWISMTYKEYAAKIAKVARYFERLGLKKGDTISIIGDNKPEWVIAEIAAQLLGAIPMGIYQDSVTEEVKYLIEKSNSKIVIAEDQEQVDKVLEVLFDVRHIEKIIYYDDRGMYQYNRPILIHFDEVLEKTSMTDSEVFDYIKSKSETVKEDDVAVLCTTSGTTGKPKLAMLTHKNLIFMSENLAKADPKFEKDEFVSFLPLPWIGEQMMCVVSALRFGFTVNFPEGSETLQEDMKEIGPNFVFSPPRVWENLASGVQVKMMDSTKFKRYVYEKMLPIGYDYADCKFEKRKPSLWLSLKYRFAYMMLFRKLKERMGFTFLRSAMTGGAALGPDTFRFFHALGISLKQIYGQTEIAGISCIHRNEDIDFTSVGLPIEGTEIKLTDDGEIVSKSDAVFAGYYNDKKATEETVTDGWLYSGDAGYFDEDGKLVVIDRMKDLMYLNDDTRFSPLFIENKIKFSPYVKEAVCLGDKRDYISLILNIDMEIVGKWAESNKMAYTTYTDLSANDKVYDLITEEVQKVNEQIPDNIQVNKFVLMYKELDADDGELTRTRKVRRGFIEEKYKEIVEAVYSYVDSVHIKAEITLQDGRVRTLETDIKIRKTGVN
jgi:long-chain acyl-CoA synthetase